jgi:phage regulator Rha-like protein
MQNLVIAVKEQPMTTTQIIAEQTGVEHASVIKLVRTYQSDLEEFAPCRFEIAVVKRPQGGGLEKEIALLNEEQTTLLITYMRNNKIVRAFKKAIVKAFFEMRNELAQRSIAITDKRQSHRPMMDALIEHRADQGKETKQHHFIIENKLCNWSVTGSFNSIDESSLTMDEMQLLAYARRTNESLIMADIPYDERKRMLAYKVENKRRKLIKLLA